MDDNPPASCPVEQTAPTLEQYPPHPESPPPQYSPEHQQQYAGPYPPRQDGFPPQQQYAGPYPVRQDGFPPQQQYAFSPPPQPAGQVIVTTEQTFDFGHYQQRLNCPVCHADVVTNISHELGNYAWMVCGLIALIGFLLCPILLLGFCLIPFCDEDCQDTIHTCPNCHVRLAVVPRT